MLVLSLFPGIGLLDHAFKLEGWQTVRGSDPIWGGDIRDDHYPPGVFAGVIGGPPCQSFSSLVHLVRANGYEPRFGNLIPEFERCVAEAAPAWFVMENVPQAPEPVVSGYSVKSFLLDNSALDAGDGFGHEQRRVRRFSFGVRGPGPAPDLRRWIDLAVFLLPDAEGSIVAGGGTPRNDEATKDRGRTRRQAVLSDPSAVPVKIGCSGKVKRTVRSGPAGPDPDQHTCANCGEPCNLMATGHYSGKEDRWLCNPRVRQVAVSASNGGNGGGEQGRTTPGAGNGGKGRYRLTDALRLQGLPETFLDHCPFTADGKLKAVANGVPVPMGRAIARAVREALR